MKRKRFTEEQTITIFKEHEAGARVVDLARHYGVAENAIYRWKSKYGGMEDPRGGVRGVIPHKQKYVRK